MESRQEMLCKVNEVSFAINDLTLYLDTHPTDAQALSMFQKYHVERRQLLQQYEMNYEPLTVDCIEIEHSEQMNSECKYQGQMHFHWVDGPLPWEGGLA